MRVCVNWCTRTRVSVRVCVHASLRNEEEGMPQFLALIAAAFTHRNWTVQGFKVIYAW
jgi:hypothetical protein